MKEVFKYAKNIKTGDQLADGRTIRGVQVILQLDDHPWYSVPSDEVMLVRSPCPTGNLDRMISYIRAAEETAQGLRIESGSEADEALRRLRRLQALIELQSRPIS